MFQSGIGTQHSIFTVFYSPLPTAIIYVPVLLTLLPILGLRFGSLVNGLLVFENRDWEVME